MIKSLEGYPNKFRLYSWILEFILGKNLVRLLREPLVEFLEIYYWGIHRKISGEILKQNSWGNFQKYSWRYLWTWDPWKKVLEIFVMELLQKFLFLTKSLWTFAWNCICMEVLLPASLKSLTQESLGEFRRVFFNNSWRYFWTYLCGYYLWNP